VFSRDQLIQFLNEADDDEYLLMKIVALFGIYGGCRKCELCKMKIDDVQDYGDHLFIRLPDTKTGVDRSFMVVGQQEPALNALVYWRKYIALRPQFPDRHLNKDRLFLHFKKGKCSQSAVGIHSFGKMPKKIASFLKLEKPELYTGHSFRRTGATLQADAGTDMVNLKRFGG